MNQLSFLQIRNPKDDETPIEAASQIFASLVPYQSLPLLKRLIFGWPSTYAFEIFYLNQTIYFYATIPTQKRTLIQSLLTSAFLKLRLRKQLIRQR